MKTNIEMQTNMVPINMTYSAVLANYRNTVNQNFPKKAVNNTKTCRRVQQTNTGHSCRVGGQRDDEWQVIGIDRTIIKVHPTYQFEHEQWLNIPETVCNHLTLMRREYQSNKRQCTSGSTYNKISQVTGGNYPSPSPTDIHVPPPIPPPPPQQQY